MINSSAVIGSTLLTTAITSPLAGLQVRSIGEREGFASRQVFFTVVAVDATFSFLDTCHNLIPHLFDVHFLSQEFFEHRSHEILVVNRPLASHAVI